MQGGGDTELVCEHKTVRRMCDICSAEPELDVLERLRARVVHLGLVIPNAVGDKRQSLEELHAEVADAIAEIERLGKLVDGLHCTNVMLRAITEAEPVRWEWRLGMEKWASCSRTQFRLGARNAYYKTRALIVAPTGETAAASPEEKAEAMHLRTQTDIGALKEILALQSQIRALLEALEKIIAEVSERRVGHREKIAEIARTAIDQARGD